MTLPGGDFEQIMSDSDALQHESELDAELHGQPPDQPPELPEAQTSDAVRDKIPYAMTQREALRLAGLAFRIDVLTTAIEKNPEAPVNYVLRGEMLLDGGDLDLAADDFHKALVLAQSRAEGANWGYIYQALADRARE